VGQLDLVGSTVLGLDAHGDRLTGSQLSAEDVDLVIRLDAVIVGGVDESERKHTLLLQVGLVDTSEGAGNDGETAQVAGLQSGVLTGRALTVVPVTDDNPLDALGLVVTGNSRDGVPGTSELVLDLVGLAVGSVDGTDEHVVRDVVQVATVLEPRAGHGDVVGGGLALSLDQDGAVNSILAIPRSERLEDLETVGSRGDLDGNGRAVLGRSLVGVTAGVVAASRKSIALRRREHELLAIGTNELVLERVEGELAGNGHGNDDIRRGNKSVGSRVAIVTTGEVAVVGRDNGVDLALLDVLTIPLADARTASVGQNDTTELLEGLELAVALNGGTDLLRTRGNGEDGLGLQTVIEGIAGNSSTAVHVLVRGVGAGADEADLELLRPAISLDRLSELRDRRSKIRSERAVDVGLKLVQVDLNNLVVLGTLIGAEAVGVDTGKVGDLLALGDRQVLVHAVIEGEEGGSGTDFSLVSN